MPTAIPNTSGALTPALRPRWPMMNRRRSERSAAPGGHPAQPK